MSAPQQIMVSQKISAGAAPAYVTENATWEELASLGTTAIPMVTAVTAGQMIIVSGVYSVGQTLGTVTDDSGNTYTIHETETANMGGLDLLAFQASAPAVSGLGIGQNVILTWNTPAFSYRWGRVHTIANATTVDVSTKATGTSANPGASDTTTAAASMIAIVVNESATYSSGAWTQIGASDFIATTWRTSYVYKNAAAAGAQDPAVTISASNTWMVVWGSYKA